MRHGTLLGLLLAGLLTSSAAGQTSDAKPGAVVNGETIAWEEVEATLAQRPPALTPLSTAQRRQLQMEIINGLIDERLMRQFLRQQNLKVDANELARKHAALLASLKEQGMTLADFCKDNHQTEAQVRASLEAIAQLEAYTRAKADEADLKAYFEANLDYFKQVLVRASHIVIRVAPDAPAEEREQARAKLRQWRQQIADKSITFAEAAKQYSQCPSAPEGGDLGTFPRKWFNLDDRIVAAAFALKPGDVSEVVDTDFGVHLVMTTERSPGQPVTFDQCLDDVRDCYMAEMRQALIVKLRQEAKVTITLP
jgi:parvulin-like peptidyl-prolyl isomerase